MKNDPLTLREYEIFQTLRELKDCDFTVIGGYAVNAYALPRFSVDCDMVIKDKNELKKIEKLLVRMGYEKKADEESQYSGRFSRYDKKLDNNFTVSVDLLVHAVADRMTGVAFTADWIFKNSGKKVLRGKTITEELELRIIDIDALLVMKMISCRSTDVRDVFMMMPKANDMEWIKSEITTRCDLTDRIDKIMEKVASKQFKDGLSGVYGRLDSKVFEKHKKAIMAFY